MPTSRRPPATTTMHYVAKSGTLTFATGETTKTITIEVKSDNKREANETFYVDLFGNITNSLFTKNRGIGTNTGDAAAAYLWYFDFDCYGDVNGRDNGEFNRRFGRY